MPAEPVEVDIKFAKRAYMITAASSTHGSIAFSVNGVTVDKATIDTVVTVTAAPEDGYEAEVPTTAGVALTPAGDNQWTFTMPGANVTVILMFTGKTYSVTSAELTSGTIAFSDLTAAGKAAVGTTITVTAKPAPGYEPDGGPTSVPSVEFTPGTGGNTWTFIMQAVDTTVSLNFKKALYTVIPGTLNYVTGLTFTVDGAVLTDGKAYMGDIVTVTAAPVDYYVAGTNKPAATGVTFIPVEGEKDKWTFTMPANNVIVGLTYVKQSFYVNKTWKNSGDEEKGDVNVPATPVQWGTTVTIRVTRKVSGYELITPTSFPAGIVFTDFVKSGNIYTSTFTMPKEDILVYFAFKEALFSALEVYNGKKEGGLNPDFVIERALTTSGGEHSWAKVVTELPTEGETRLAPIPNSGDAGYDGGATSLKSQLPSSGNNNDEFGFIIKAEYPINLKASGIVGLSVRMKRNKAGNRSVDLLGFGEHVDAAANPHTNVWLVDDGAYPVRVTNEWKQFIIPVPNNADVTITTAFIMRTRLDKDEYILVDDIKFITEGVSKVTTIEMDTGALNRNVTIERGDTIPAIARSAVASATVQRKYNTTAIGEVQLLPKNVGYFADNYDPAAWGLGAAYTVDGDAALAGDTITLNNSANITENAIRTFTVKASADGGAAEVSRTVTVNVTIPDDTAPRIIEDFSKAGEHSNGGNGWLSDYTNAVYGYWVKNMATNSVSWIHNNASGSKSKWFLEAHPDAAGVMAGRVLSSRVKISGNTFVTIDFRRNNSEDAYALVLYSGAAFNNGGGSEADGEPTAGIREEVAFTAPPQGSAWNTIKIPVSSFTVVNTAAINGWAIIVKDKKAGTGDETKFFVNFIGTE